MGRLRAVGDIGTHWMDLVTFITGLEVEAVFADLSTVHKVRNRPVGEVETYSGKIAGKVATKPVAIDTEDYGCVMFRFRGGARGSLYVSQVTAGRKNCMRYEIAASGCALAWASESPSDLWIGHRDQPNQWLMRDPALVAPSARRYINYPGGHNEGFPDAFKQCFRAFYDHIAGADPESGPIYPTFEAGHRDILLCEAILASHQQQRWVELQ